MCGINGVTYTSECYADVDYSLTDYAGECREFGRLNNAIASSSVCSSTVRCSGIITDICPAGVTVVQPPGACCGICAGAMRVMYSRKQVDRAMYALPAHDQHLITQQGVMAALQRLIRTAGCRVFGYLTVEADLFVAVESIDELKEPLQMIACAREAEKLATLIATQSAQIASDVALSTLIGAQMIGADGGWDWGDVDHAGGVNIVRSNVASMLIDERFGLVQGLLAFLLLFYSRVLYRVFY